MTPEQKERLLKLFMELSQLKDFPHKKCERASCKVTWLDGFRNYRVERGFFLVDMPIPNGAGNWGYLFGPHNRCRGPEDIIVDLTAHQFNEWLYEKLPAEPLIIGPSDTLFKRYLPADINREEYRRPLKAYATMQQL